MGQEERGDLRVVPLPVQGPSPAGWVWSQPCSTPGGGQVAGEVITGTNPAPAAAAGGTRCLASP